MSMTSVYSTPRNQNMHTRNFEGMDANDSQMDMYSNQEMYSPGAARTGYYDGRLNSQADWQGITPRMHK